MTRNIPHMTTVNSAPKIYVACLSSYNAGQLHGVWIDCDDAYAYGCGCEACAPIVHELCAVCDEPCETYHPVYTDTPVCDFQCRREFDLDRSDNA